MQGRTVDDYDAPLFLAWQLTNRCSARCLACCEESGPDKAWRDELSRGEALRLAEAIVDLGIPFAAFGGGEPLGVAHCWDVFERLAAGGVALKLETDGSREPFEDIPAVRHAERLAAAEGDEGNAEIDDGAGQAERLVAAQLIAPGPAGAGFLAAGKAACAAAVGQLPGKEKGRIVVIDGAPPHRIRFSVRFR